MRREILYLAFFFTFAIFGAANASNVVSGKDNTGAEEDTRQSEYIDSMIMVDDIQITAIKQGLTLRNSPIASTVVGATAAARGHITAIKDLSQIAPNLHIPDYGSRMTSSIYVRGLGARIDQPVMGLNIDNVPYMNKDAYDMELGDIERIEVLRGPQSTLYGRNTMGGVMNIYTLSPMTYEGIRIGGEYSSGNSYKVKASVYQRPFEKFAMAVSGYYSSSDGFFENLHSGELCDWERSAGGRLKLQYRPTKRLSIDNTLSFSTLKQGGYPYAFVGEDIIEQGNVVIRNGEIRYNDEASYRRTSISDALTVKYTTDKFTFASITSYQLLDDRMMMDQDFLPLSYFTLMQQRKEHAITEEIVFRSTNESGYRWLVGAFGFWKQSDMYAPVVFREDGIERLIIANVEDKTGLTPVFPEEFPLDSRFDMPTFGAAIYHESSYALNRWLFTAGIRIDHERAKMHYRSNTTESCAIGTNTINPFDIEDTLNDSFTEILPKVSVQYRFGDMARNSVYASVAKGYKAGGFNTQMFSEVLQTELMARMNVFPDHRYTVEEIVAYKPEKSWNYEIGAHYESRHGHLRADAAIFYIDCTDQQLTVFPKGSITGRMMTNAGHTRSYGAELSLATSCRGWDITASYGYTNARFVEYLYDETKGIDYKGNYIPYSPQHTLAAAVSYSININRKWLENIVLRVDTSGAGKIYWNEANTLYQSFYALLGTSIRLEHKNYSIDIWGRNLTNTRYAVFYFKSMGNEFLQYARPRTFGITLNINI